MGNLLKVLSNKDDPFHRIDFYVDFENCKPNNEDMNLWQIVDDVLKASVSILDDLRNYPGASNEIRAAISNPQNEELQEIAWDSVCPLVLQLKNFYQFSVELGMRSDLGIPVVTPGHRQDMTDASSRQESTVPKILCVLTSGDLTSKEHLEQQQALFKQYAEILDFTLRFDDSKMNNPAIQNDFSYYRRTLSRMKMSCQDEIPDVAVNNELANRMSLFYANPTPMMKTLSDVTAKFVSENKQMPVTNTTDCLSTMANICRAMIENPDYVSRMQKDETMMFCLRVMVGVIILYDHVHPVGAFAKTSGIDMKASIKLLKDQPSGTVDTLLNVLRYTSKHLNDETTPKNILIMLS